MYVLDTDTLSRMRSDDPRLWERRQRIGTELLATTVITRIEILQGRFDSVVKAADGDQLLQAFAWLVRSEELLGQITILPIDAAAAAEFDRLRQNKKLKKIGRGDLLIAAVVLAHRATLVSRNLRDFRQVPGLQVENWLA
jgi:tRNA(fMet)-specific endonuclease VapC